MPWCAFCKNQRKTTKEIKTGIPAPISAENISLSLKVSSKNSFTILTNPTTIKERM